LIKSAINEFHPSQCTPSLLVTFATFIFRFEGEFQAGYAHGLGMFTSEMRGEVFIGEFFGGQRHG
jgi:hypothetical protein